MKYLLTFACIFFIWVSPGFSQSISADTVVASRDFKKGITFLTAQRYDSSLTYFQKALSAFETGNDWLKIIVCLNKIAESQFGASDYPGAEKSAEKVLKLCAEKLSADHVQTGYALTVLGNVVMYTKVISTLRWHCITRPWKSSGKIMVKYIRMWPRPM